MFRTLFLALRSLRVRTSRTLLTTFGIVLGVAVILAISVTNQSTISSVTSVFNQASGKAHLIVIRASSGERGLPADLAYRVAATPGVAAAVPSLQAQVLLADEISPSQREISFLGAVGGGLLLYGVDPSLDRQAREYKLADGEFLSSDLNAHQIVLVADYAKRKDLRIGQDLEIFTPRGIEVLRIVGLLSKEGAGQLNNGGFGIIPLGTAQKIFERTDELDQVDVVATPAMASGPALEALKASLLARLGEEYSVLYPASQGERVTQMLDVYQMGLNFFSVIALFVGAFLIYNAFSMTVVERTREIGILRTLGMTRGQVMRQVLAEAAILAVVGALLGVGLGILLSHGLIRVMESLLVQEVKEIRIPLDGLLISLAVGVCVTLLAAAMPAWQASRVSPLEAVRVRGLRREGWIIRRGWTLGVVLLVASTLLLLTSPFPPELQYQVDSPAIFALFVGATLLVPATTGTWERLARPAIQRLLGAEGRLGGSNIQRARLRTALTAASLMTGVAMLLSIRALTDAFSQDLREWIEAYIGGDLYVHSSLPMRTYLARRFETVEGVTAATPMRYFEVEWLKEDGTDERLTFMAVDPGSYRQVTSFVFQSSSDDPERLLDRLAAGDAVFVSTILAEKYGLRRGDTMRLKTHRGQRVFEIAGVVVDFNNQGLTVEGSWKDMRRYFGLRDVNAFLIKVQPGYSPADVQERLDQAYGKRHHITVESNETLKTRALQLSAQTFGLFDVLTLIAMIVAALGVVNTLTMNVLERTQEIGMLRSLGMTRWQVGKMILAEAGMLGLIGGVFGLLFGLFMSRLFISAANATQGYELAYVLPTQGILVGLMIALVVSQVAAIWPAQRAAGIRIIEAIQCE
jgi:putative ABC transport system permease protein